MQLFQISTSCAGTEVFLWTHKMKVKAYLEITMQIAPANRPAAAKVYQDYRAPFLSNITGALSKELLVRDLDVQVIHGFDSPEHAQAYLTSDLFKNDVAPSSRFGAQRLMSASIPSPNSPITEVTEF